LKLSFALAGLVLFAGPSLSYFQYQRPVQLAGAGQNYIAVDETLWRHAKADLGDLRLYSGQTEIPYALITEYGSQQSQKISVPVLQQSSVSGNTQFLVDMSGLAEYDHVNLDLSTKNFVAHAKVEGSDDPHAKTWALLGDSILYDLSKENLGGNRVLRLPRATYKYLRVTVDGPVKPEDITGASSEQAEDHPAQWRDVSGDPQQSQNGKDTVFTFNIDVNMPVERVIFTVAAGQPDFSRNIEIQDENGRWVGSGEINRIHMVRAGRKIDSDDHTVQCTVKGQNIIKVAVHNGDDRPLQLAGVKLQQLARRVYFNPPVQQPVRLYYGDPKLEAPVYDYTKLFLQDKSAGMAQLEPEVANATYMPRPDERPWSERHPVVLWAAIIVAVLGLGGVALRSMRGVA
jgi:hypothetical protein